MVICFYGRQDEGAATRAAKLDKAEGQLDFREEATVLHNKVCLQDRHTGLKCIPHDWDNPGNIAGKAQNLIYCAESQVSGHARHLAPGVLWLRRHARQAWTYYHHTVLCREAAGESL